MTLINKIGYLGSFLFSIRMLPQIYNIYTNGIIEGLSENFILLDLSAAFCLLIYSYSLRALPMIITNFLAFVCDIIFYLLFKDIKRKKKILNKNETNLSVLTNTNMSY